VEEPKKPKWKTKKEERRVMYLAFLFYLVLSIIVFIWNGTSEEDEISDGQVWCFGLFFCLSIMSLAMGLGSSVKNIVSPSEEDEFTDEWKTYEKDHAVFLEAEKKKVAKKAAEPRRKTAKKAHITEYTNNLYFFYTKDYPSNFSGPLINSMGGFDSSDLSPEFRKAAGNLSVPSPQQWISLQNNSTKGINPPTNFKLNDRLFFILIHGFVSSFQSIIEQDWEEPFIGLTKSKINFHTEESRKAFFEEHSNDIEEITGRSSSYEQYESVLEHYKNIYHDKIKKAIRGTSTTMMVNLGFDFRIGMKAGILNTEVIIESLYISGFRNVLKSFYPLLNKKMEYFSDGKINGYCKDLLYRYSKIARIKTGMKMTEVNFSFRATKKEMRNNLLDTSSGLFNFDDLMNLESALQIGIARDKPDDLKKFKKEYKELKNKATKFTEIK